MFFYVLGILILDTFVALKMLDQVTPEMKKLGEGALPDGGFYPVSFITLSSSSSVILIIFIIIIIISHLDHHYHYYHHYHLFRSSLYLIIK
jgi:hypothetical protein